MVAVLFHGVQGDLGKTRGRQLATWDRECRLWGSMNIPPGGTIAFLVDKVLQRATSMPGVQEFFHLIGSAVIQDQREGGVPLWGQALWRQKQEGGKV